MTDTPSWHDLPTSREGLLALADEHLASARSLVDVDGGSDYQWRVGSGTLATADATIALALIARAGTVPDLVDPPTMRLLGRDDDPVEPA